MNDVPSPRVIEELAFDAWPAAEVADCGGWRMRFNRGVTNRGNSVWACDWRGGHALAALERVERFYRDRGRSASFQITPASKPEGLDSLLAVQGYQRVLPVSVEWARAEQVARLPCPAPPVIECNEHISDAWFELSGRRGRFVGDQIPVYRQMMEKLKGRACFALARAGPGGAPLGVALGVAGDGEVGVFSMLTLPEHRGRGVGRALLAGIARWALGRNCAGLYLQVEEDNAAARSLYTRAGFEPVYGYHYRRGPDQPARGARPQPSSP